MLLQATLICLVTMAAARDPTEAARAEMVETIARRGIQHAGVLSALRAFPRHELVPEPLRHLAYEDRPLPIGAGQTISQPYMVAFMTEAADVSPGEKVLEVGTGSGYQAAILAAIGARVYSIEIVPELAERARADLGRLGVKNVEIRHGDGYRGWPEEAPFDAIVVTAAPDHVPPALLGQLADAGRLVIPVGPRDRQVLEIHTRYGERITTTRTFPVRFVPMTGKAQDRPTHH